MTTWDFIIPLFYEVEEQMRDRPQHPPASLWPRAVGPWGRRLARKGVAHRAC